jgi:hypothetical protein
MVTTMVVVRLVNLLAVLPVVSPVAMLEKLLDKQQEQQ